MTKDEQHKLDYSLPFLQNDVVNSFRKVTLRIITGLEYMSTHVYYRTVDGNRLISISIGDFEVVVNTTDPTFKCIVPSANNMLIQVVPMYSTVTLTHYIRTLLSNFKDLYNAINQLDERAKNELFSFQ